MIKIPANPIYGEELEKYLRDVVWKHYTDERDRLTGFQQWTRAGQACPKISAVHRNAERQVLLELSRTPWMGLMVKTFAQQLIVDGYKKSGSTKNAKAWETWRKNNMQAQQFTLNRDILTYGYSYVKVTDSVDPLTGEQMCSLRVKSPKQVFAIYEDPYDDEWPKYVLERQPNGEYWWWSDEDYVILTVPGAEQPGLAGGNFKVKETIEHEYGLVPFVRYVNDIDDDGRCWGDVEPVVEVAKRIDKTKFDLLLAQHFTGFMVRWATGLQQPDNDPDVEKAKMKLAQETILASSNKDAKFGVLQPAPLDGLLEAYKASLFEFLTLTQMPPSVAGQIVNVAADALAAGTRPTVQKLWEKQAMFTMGHNRVMRLVNILEGRGEEANDIDMSVHWQDVEIKSLSQFADAWGKMVDQLKIPAWGVWDMIPGIDQSTTDGWRENYKSDDPFIAMVRELQNAKALQASRGGPTGAQNQQGANNKTGDPASLNKQQPGARQ
jgi:hypothetical protein